jgi:hypothetical protein
MLILTAVMALAAASPPPVETTTSQPVATQTQQQAVANEATMTKSAEQGKKSPAATPHCRVISKHKLLGHEVTHTKCD